jgi:proteic killer suppression protein
LIQIRASLSSQSRRPKRISPNCGFSDSPRLGSYEKGDPSKLSVENHDRVLRLLRRLAVATSPDEMNAPGLFFHALTGDQRGRFSVRVSGNWRLTFAFDGEDAIDLDLEDYH